jgi:hypothetical protein
MSRQAIVVAVALFALGVAPAWAQENEPGKSERVSKTEKTDARAEQEGLRSIRGVTASLRVQLVISRYQGEKRNGSLPYSLVVTAGGDRVRMRMGVDTPVPTTAYTTTTGPDGTQKVPYTSYSYRNVGTNIDCLARDFGDGRYQLNLTVENSSALSSADRSGDLSVAGAPLFRRFETSLNPLLRDGQTVQTVASTDPVTGEVVKIDVTLNVVK